MSAHLHPSSSYSEIGDTMKAIKVPAGYGRGGPVEDTAVFLADEENGMRAVILDGSTIGYVWKGTRRYSPPTHKGSRVAKYHKDVPEWQGNTKPMRYSPDFRRDTRMEILRDFISVARHAA